MRLPISSCLFNRLAGQLLALFVLYIAMVWLLPIVAATLLNGMLLWSNAAKLYGWVVQYAFIAVAIELRETLIQKAAHWFRLLPLPWLRPVLAMANVLVLLVMLSAVWLLLKNSTAFSFAIAVEWLLLLTQVWCLCGAAVPMSAKRFYVFFFKYPKRPNENWSWEKQRTELI